MLHTLQTLVSDLSPYLQQYGYLLLALAIAVEGFGIPAPGQALLMVSGVLAADGELALHWVLLVATLSAFSGNLVGYFLGLKGDSWLRRKGWMSADTEARLHRFIGRYGIAVLLLSRFVEGLKQTMALGCGLANMPLRAFLLGNALATAVWVGIFGLGPALLWHERTALTLFYHAHTTLTWSVLVVGLLSTLLLWRWRAHQTVLNAQ
ncbi:DedA family protein [Ferrimonas balearica]|uniref:DedA family protein n=1 Tax=Ferrimonas balearica TaxID=44012 RepID=UPI001C9953C7|nr:DedA family protein [Ferrimonas balearica]MBY5923277.1 DedA family protein [Ferrimonas balearica]MBY5995235.1 DedA family protein [Ferrimonas balearica]